VAERVPIPDLTPAEFTARIVDLGQPAYRARQVLRWLYRRGAPSFDQMTDLPAALRAATANGARNSAPGSMMRYLKLTW